jgi:hypothetical protein
MMTFLKIITLPVWLPFKILWFASKVVAFCFLVVVLALLIVLAVHFL